MDLLDVFKDSEDLVEFPAGAVIITEGKEGNQMYVVMEGEVSISLKDTLLATAKPGEIVGEMALINSDLRSATVTAKTRLIAYWRLSIKAVSSRCFDMCRNSRYM
jgi:CRP-like cAMP-binding protein